MDRETADREPRLVRLGSTLGALTGWRRNLLLFVAGCGVTLSMAPFHGWPLLPVSFPILFNAVLRSTRLRRAYFDGWWFAFGFFSSGIYWFAYALMVDVAKFGWMIPFAVFGLAAFFGFYFGLTGIALRLARHVRWPAWPLLAAGAWTAIDWVRSYLFTGFAWNALGHVFTASLPSLQASAWLGVWSLGWLAVAVAVMPAWFLQPAGARARRGQGAAFAFGLLLIVLLCLGGAWRLKNHPTRYAQNADFRLVQAGVEQYEKWNPADRLRSVARQAGMTRGPGFDKVRFVVWSETSMLFPFGSHDEWAERLATLVPKDGDFITGVVRIESAPEELTRPYHLYNSLQMLDATGAVVASYDKRKLVPFGEFVPLREILPIEKVTHGAVDFSWGKRAEHIPLSGGVGSIFPLICYEATFSELSDDAWPSTILNITNDTWFGRSTGPYQHLAMARMRAVEQGVGLLRAANSGVSAAIDPYGRILKSLPLGAVGVLDTKLPESLPHPTFFSRFGQQSFVLLLVISFAGAALMRRPASNVSLL